MKFIRSPINYVGGKYKLLKHIWDFIPNVNQIISPFFGGGTIELNLAYHKGVYVQAFDICPYLMVFWQHFIGNPIRVYDLAVDILKNNSYEQLREMHDTYTSKLPVNTVEEAAIYYLFNKAGYRGCGLTYNIRRQQVEKGQKVLGKRENISAFDVKQKYMEFLCADFTESLANNTKLAICDPPYVSTELYQPGSNTASKHLFNHNALNEILKSRESWILFYNHCPELPYVRLAYAGYYYFSLHQKSTLSNKNFVNWILFSHDIAEELLTRGVLLERG